MPKYWRMSVLFVIGRFVRRQDAQILENVGVVENMRLPQPR